MKTARMLMLMAALALLAGACGGGGGGGGGGSGTDAALAPSGTWGGGGSSPSSEENPAADAGEEEPQNPAQPEGAVNPPPVADHTYLAHVLLSGPRDHDLDRARDRLQGYEVATLREVLEELGAELPDELIDRMLAIAMEAGNEEMLVEAAGLDRLLELVEADRRQARGQSRMSLLASEIVLAGQSQDSALEQGMADAAAALDGYWGGLQSAVEAGLRQPDLGLNSPQSSLAPPPLAPEPGALAGMAQLDQLVLKGPLMARALAGDQDAADLVRAMYNAFEALLVANPPDPLGMMVGIRAVLDALPQAPADEEAGADEAAEAGSLDLELIAEPAFDEVTGELTAMLIRASGVADQLQVSWGFEVMAGMDAQPRPEGLLIRADGPARDVMVTGDQDGRHGEIVVRVGSEAQALEGRGVMGRVIDSHGVPIADAIVECRESGSGVIFGQMQAGADGSFSFDRLPPSALEILVRSGNREASVHLPEQEFGDLITELDAIVLINN